MHSRWAADRARLLPEHVIDHQARAKCSHDEADESAQAENQKVMQLLKPLNSIGRRRSSAHAGLSIGSQLRPSYGPEKPQGSSSAHCVAEEAHCWTGDLANL